MRYFIDIESIPARYSTQWREWIPKLSKAESVTISGTDYTGLTKGGFFDFNSTNVYKAEQTVKLSELFRDGKIKDGDEFFFYDVWHPGVISLKYMIDLGKLNCKIYGIMHAGSYDETDILGMNKLYLWADSFEKSIFKACDKVFVASNYHKDMILRQRSAQTYSTGLPFCFDDLEKYKILSSQKENIFVFPHRLSPDKQPEIFDDLKEMFPDYDFIKTGDLDLSKPEYYKLLAKSKFQFSCSLHENWGISVFESMFLGCVPIIPDRCSYREMYGRDLVYESIWTYSPKHWKQYKDHLKTYITMVMLQYDEYYTRTQLRMERVKKYYCDWDRIEEEMI
jgi:glycosyltransferase involved in cell wall biosynthesis|tara:strand:+ start:1598 stop:2608 length:1011 start_codon:yes stop_codon:yes gene_type:complete